MVSKTGVFRWGLAAAVIAGLLTGGCRQPSAAEAPAPQQAPPAVANGEVRIQEVSRPYIEVQELAAAAQAGSAIAAPAHVDFRDGAVSQVGAPLDGRVSAVHVLIGERVTPGSPLVTLDCPEAAAARASERVAESSLREARLELERQDRMQKEGVGVERDMVAAQTKVASAEAELARVESTTASLGAGSASAVVVRAPIAGVVIARKASVGMAVEHGADPLVEIGDTSQLWVVADVFERDLAHVHQGDKCTIAFPSLDHQMDARVTAIGNVVSPALRTVPVFLSPAAQNAALRPGMYGRATIDSAGTGLTLPVAAVLITESGDPVVYVQKDPLTYVRRRVVVSQPFEGRVQIVSGVAPGEKVVVRGALLLDGAADQLS